MAVGPRDSNYAPHAEWLQMAAGPHDSIYVPHAEWLQMAAGPHDSIYVPHLGWLQMAVEPRIAIIYLTPHDCRWLLDREQRQQNVMYRTTLGVF